MTPPGGGSDPCVILAQVSYENQKYDEASHRGEGFWPKCHPSVTWGGVKIGKKHHIFI